MDQTHKFSLNLVDCVWGEWTDWGDCEQITDGHIIGQAFEGSQTRTREVETLEANDGNPCEGDDEQIQFCLYRDTTCDPGKGFLINKVSAQY